MEERKSCQERANEILLEQLEKLSDKIDKEGSWPTVGPLARDLAAAMAALTEAICDI